MDIEAQMEPASVNIIDLTWLDLTWCVSGACLQRHHIVPVFVHIFFISYFISVLLIFIYIIWVSSFHVSSPHAMFIFITSSLTSLDNGHFREFFSNYCNYYVFEQTLLLLPMLACVLYEFNSAVNTDGQCSKVDYYEGLIATLDNFTSWISLLPTFA